MRAFEGIARDGDRLLAVYRKFGGGRGEIEITPAEADAIIAWEAGELVDRALPDWSSSKRELLLSGMDDEQWNRAFPEDE